MAGTVCLVLPYLVLAAPAGYLADRFPKRSVIVGCKLAEIVIMVLGVGGDPVRQPAGDVGGGPAVGDRRPARGAGGACSRRPARAAFRKCCKPELISKANGLFTLATVIATVIGMVIGNWLADATGDRRAWIGGGSRRWC